MKLKSRSRLVVGLTTLVAAMQFSAPVSAQEMHSNMLGKIEPSLRDRLFWRLDYIRANVKSTVGAVRDVSGPVVAKGEIFALRTKPDSFFYDNAGNVQYAKKPDPFTGNPVPLTGASFVSPGTQLDAALEVDAAGGYECQATGLGSPCNMRARGQSMIGTPAISVGYFLGDDHTWAVEAFILAKPIEVSIYGDGPNQLNGKEIITTKLLPPVVKFGRYFGGKNDRIRPYVGLLGSYAIFYDSKATDNLNNYVGGMNAKDTTINLKNVMGFGLMLGAEAKVGDGWNVGLSVGKIRYRTTATITTRNTRIDNDTPATKDYGNKTLEAIGVGEDEIGTGRIMCAVAKAKNGSTDCNLGTYTRESNNILDNTLFVLSAGRSF